MNNQQLTLEQIEQLNQVSDPVARRRFSVLFQLPQDLQTAFESEQTENSVWDIAKVKYDLADRDVSKVARIIGLIFLGELPIKNFIAELRNKLNIDTQKAQAIAQDINKTIFQPVRISLMQVHGISDANQRMDTNDTNKNTNINQSKSIQPTQYQTPSRPQPVKLTPPAYQPNYGDAQKRRDEVLSKIRQQQPPPLRSPSAKGYGVTQQGSAGQAPPAKPASFYFSRTIRPNRLKPAPKKKNINKYNSFFS